MGHRTQSTIAALTAFGLSVAAANAALGAVLESVARGNMLISFLTPAVLCCVDNG